jgi:hypothetical protein
MFHCLDVYINGNKHVLIAQANMNALSRNFKNTPFGPRQLQMWDLWEIHLWAIQSIPNKAFCPPRVPRQQALRPEFALYQTVIVYQTVVNYCIMSEKILHYIPTSSRVQRSEYASNELLIEVRPIEIPKIT